MKLKCNCCDGVYNTVDIHFTSKCDNNCSFCIDKHLKNINTITDVNAIMDSVIATGTKEVLILGGEPFLEIERLLDFVTRLKKENIVVYITTSLPKQIEDNWKTFLEIFDLVDGLNISMQHYLTSMNNKVYNNNKHNRILLAEKVIKENPDKVRICLNLVKGYVDRYYDVVMALRAFNRIGAKHIKLNELSYSDDYVSYEKIMNVKMKSPYASGCYTKVTDSLFPKGMNIMLKRSCFVIQKGLKANIFDLIKIILKKIFVDISNIFCVVYEDGKIEKNWRKE